jgi:carboxyl-terminal processing protease
MKNIIVIIFSLLILASCDKMFLYDEAPDNPVSTFDYLWNDFDRNYGGFIVKNINWDSLYSIYRPQVNNEMSDEELYRVATGLLRHLNDNHVGLYPNDPNLEAFSSGILGTYERCNDFKISVVESDYLSEHFVYEDDIVYGKLPDNLGYIHFKSFGNKVNYYVKAMDKMLDYLKATKGIIVDIRSHGGGDDKVSQYIAGRFASSKELFMIVRLKDGPEHNAFSEPIYMYVEPEAGYCFTKPVVLLTNRFSVSAAETYTWAMNTLENVTQIGDTTSGAFSDMIIKELPNGWGYSISVGQWNDRDDRNWEGIGISPDILVENDSTDVANGIDRALEQAVEFLNAEQK